MIKKVLGPSFFISAPIPSFIISHISILNIPKLAILILYIYALINVALKNIKGLNRWLLQLKLVKFNTKQKMEQL